MDSVHILRQPYDTPYQDVSPWYVFMFRILFKVGSNYMLFPRKKCINAFALTKASNVANLDLLPPSGIMG